MEPSLKAVKVIQISCKMIPGGLTAFDKAAIAVGITLFVLIIVGLFLGFYCWKSKKVPIYDKI